MAIAYPTSASLVLANVISVYMEASYLHLFTNAGYNPSSSSAIGDFTEANYYGYAKYELTSAIEPYLDVSGGSDLPIQKVFYYSNALSGQIASNTIYGWYVQDAANNLIVCGTFPSGVPMNQVGDACIVNIALNMFSN